MNLELVTKFLNFVEEKAGVEKPYAIKLKLGEKIPKIVENDVELDFSKLKDDPRIVIPEGTIFNRDLTISGARYYNNDNFRIPNDLTVKGEFNLSQYSHELDGKLSVGRGLRLSHSTFTIIPTLNVEGNASLYNLPYITKISDNFVCRFLHVTECKNLKVLGNDMDIKLSLHVTKTPIVSLGEKLKPFFFITLDETEIEDLPSDLMVWGGLDIKNSPILKKYTLSQIKEKLPHVNKITGDFLPE
jgi:hypothetical protein